MSGMRKKAGVLGKTIKDLNAQMKMFTDITDALVKVYVPKKEEAEFLCEYRTLRNAILKRINEVKNVVEHQNLRVNVDFVQPYTPEELLVLKIDIIRGSSKCLYSTETVARLIRTIDTVNHKTLVANTLTREE